MTKTTKMIALFTASVTLTTATLLSAFPVGTNASAAEGTSDSSESTPVIEPTVTQKTKGVEVDGGYTTTDLDAPVSANSDGYIDKDLRNVQKGDIQSTVDQRDANVETKVYVDVEWTSLNFIYDFGSVSGYDWDVDTMRYKPKETVYKYGDKTKASWNNNSEIKVTFSNHSNTNVFVGVYFEKSKDPMYENVEVKPKKEDGWQLNLLSAVETQGVVKGDIILSVTGAPSTEILNCDDPPQLGAMKFYINERARKVADTPVTSDEPENGEHVCHFVYDQFGRLVCTGCNKVKHEYCIDEDEDGLCDECGLERDFCPDCHLGGICKCT